MEENDLNFYIKELLEIDRKNVNNAAKLCAIIARLEKLKAVQAVEPLLIIALDETIPQDSDQNDPRIYAVWALGALKDKKATKPLIDLLLESDYTQLRCAAAVALGELGDSKAIPALEHAINHDTNRLSYGGFDTDVVGAATLAITQINQTHKDN